MPDDFNFVGFEPSAQSVTSQFEGSSLLAPNVISGQIHGPLRGSGAFMDIFSLGQNMEGMTVANPFKAFGRTNYAHIADNIAFTQTSGKIVYASFYFKPSGTLHSQPFFSANSNYSPIASFWRADLHGQNIIALSGPTTTAPFVSGIVNICDDNWHRMYFESHPRQSASGFVRATVDGVPICSGFFGWPDALANEKIISFFFGRNHNKYEGPLIAKYDDIVVGTSGVPTGDYYVSRITYPSGNGAHTQWAPTLQGYISVDDFQWDGDAFVDYLTPTNGTNNQRSTFVFNYVDNSTYPNALKPWHTIRAVKYTHHTKGTQNDAAVVIGTQISHPSGGDFSFVYGGLEIGPLSNTYLPVETILTRPQYTGSPSVFSFVDLQKTACGPLAVSGYAIGGASLRCASLYSQVLFDAIPVATSMVPLYMTAFDKKNNSFDLYISTNSTKLGNLDLFTIGGLTGVNVVPLVTQGFTGAASGLDLFLNALGNTATGMIPLITIGGLPASSSVPLHTVSFNRETAFMNLFAKTVEPFTKTNNVPLFISSSLSGINAMYDTLPLFMQGARNSGILNLFLRGPNTQPVTSNMNLFIGGQYGQSTNILPLYLHNLGTAASLPLHIQGSGITAGATPFSKSMNLYLHRPFEAGVNLFLKGPGDPATGTLPLYLSAVLGASSGVSLFMLTRDVPSSGCNLYVHGF